MEVAWDRKMKEVKDPETGRNMMMSSANVVVLEEVLVGWEFAQQMNEYHQMVRNMTIQNQRARYKWGKGVTWQFIADNVGPMLDRRIMQDIDFHSFVEPRPTAENTRQMCKMALAQELGFNTQVGDHGIAAPRSGTPTF